MNILITGGAGFIGSNLADHLLKIGERVIVLDNLDNFYDVSLKRENIAHNLLNPYYKFYKGDICNLKALNKVFTENNIEAVVHLAACAGVRNSFLYPQKYARTNIEGTLNVLEKMKEFGVKKLIFASSSSVYGNCNEEVFAENLINLKPISPYAITKLMGESLISLYNINAVCLRFFTVYGPRQRPDLAIQKFADCIKNNKPITLYGDGTTVRDYTYVGDIVNGICLALNYNETKYEVINLGSGHPISLNEMVKTLESILGKKAIIDFLPMQEGDVLRTSADISKAGRLLNYIPQATFEEALRTYII